ncbi:MAG: SIMPL domain-containing protein [Acidobacteriia bacterium]|nr:SIMPL domain-containing protein [Terriglobia bacterium]
MHVGRSNLILLVALVLPKLAAGQVPPPSIQVSAEAVVAVKPDQALIQVGVVTQSATAQAATAENAQRVDATITAIRNVLGNGGEIKTVGYSVRPVYRYPKEGGTPAITGYTASNVVQITMNDLAGVGRVIDTATASGANTIQQLQFTLKDDQAVQLRALNEAATKAKAKAQAMAAALGLKMVRVLRAEEQGGVVRPQSERLYMMAGAATAPQTTVEPGTVEVHATVTLTVEVGQ